MSSESALSSESLEEPVSIQQSSIIESIRSIKLRHAGIPAAALDDGSWFRDCANESGRKTSRVAATEVPTAKFSSALASDIEQEGVQT